MIDNIQPKYELIRDFIQHLMENGVSLPSETLISLEIRLLIDDSGVSFIDSKVFSLGADTSECALNS